MNASDIKTIGNYEDFYNSIVSDITGHRRYFDSSKETGDGVDFEKEINLIDKEVKNIEASRTIPFAIKMEGKKPDNSERIKFKKTENEIKRLEQELGKIRVLFVAQLKELETKRESFKNLGSELVQKVGIANTKEAEKAKADIVEMVGKTPSLKFYEGKQISDWMKTRNELIERAEKLKNVNDLYTSARTIFQFMANNAVSVDKKASDIVDGYFGAKASGNLNTISAIEEYYSKYISVVANALKETIKDGLKSSFDVLVNLYTDAKSKLEASSVEEKKSKEYIAAMSRIEAFFNAKKVLDDNKADDKTDAMKTFIGEYKRHYNADINSALKELKKTPKEVLTKEEFDKKSLAGQIEYASKTGNTLGKTVADVIKDAKHGLKDWQKKEILNSFNKKDIAQTIEVSSGFESDINKSKDSGYIDELNDMLYILKNADYKNEVINGEQISDIITTIETAINSKSIEKTTEAYNKYKGIPNISLVEQYKYHAKDIPNAPKFEDIVKSGVDAIRAMAQVIAYKNTQEQLSKSAENNKNKVAQASINAQIDKNSKVIEDNMKALNARIKYARRLERTPAELKGVKAMKEQYAKEFKKKGIYDSATAMTKESKPSDFGLTNASKLTEDAVSDKENLSVIEQMQSDFNDLSNNNSKLSDINYAGITNYRIAKDVNGFYKELQKIHKQILSETKKLSDDLRVKLQEETNLSIKTLLNSAIGEITAWSSKYNYNKAKDVYDSVVPAYNKAKMDTSIQGEYAQDTGEETRKIVIEQNKKDYPDNIMEKYLEVFNGKPLDEVPQDIYSAVRDGIVNIRSLFKNNQPEDATIEYNRIIGMLESYANSEATASLETNILKDEANKLLDKLLYDIEVQRTDMPISENEVVDSAIEKMKMFADEGNQNEIQIIYNALIPKIKQAKIVAKKEYVQKINSRAKQMVDDLVLRRNIENDKNKIVSINKAITAIISFASRFDSESMEQLYAKTIEELGSYAGIDMLDIADKFIEISKYKNIIMQSNPDLWKNIEESYNSNSTEFFKQYYTDAMNLISSLSKTTKPSNVPVESKNTTPEINTSEQ